MKSDEKLIPVRDAHRFDESGLSEYLQYNLKGYTDPLNVQQFEGGTVESDISDQLRRKKIRPSQKASR